MTTQDGRHQKQYDSERAVGGSIGCHQTARKNFLVSVLGEPCVK